MYVINLQKKHALCTTETIQKTHCHLSSPQNFKCAIETIQKGQTMYQNYYGSSDLIKRYNFSIGVINSSLSEKLD